MDNIAGNGLSDTFGPPERRPDGPKRGRTGKGLEGYFQSIVEASPLGIVITDGHNRCVFSNAMFLSLSRQSFAETLGKIGLFYVNPDDLARMTEAGDWITDAPASPPRAVRLLRSGGATVWIRITIVGHRHEGGVQSHIHMIENVTDVKSAKHQLTNSEKALFSERARAAVTMNAIGDAVLTTDVRGNVTDMNRTAEAMTGWSLTEALDRPLTDVFNLVEAASRAQATNPALRAISENRMVEFEADCILIQRDGTESAIEDSSTPIHGRDGEVTGAVVVFHDVSQSRAMVKELAFMAHHDFLTGLPNRALLAERFQQAIGQAGRHNKQVALLFLDVDFFKKINDSLGHAVGDQVLRAVAGRLVQCVRTTDTVSRQGGDEFVVLLAEISGAGEAARVAQKLIAVFAEDQFVDGHEIRLTLSIGISVFPADGPDVDTIMQNADTAMYHAKTTGRNNYQFFEQELNTRAIERLNLESGLRRALRQNEFQLMFQPQIELATNTLIGAEVLIRWQDPALGLLLPGQFIAAAEDCGLIIPIGHWVLFETCRQIRQWLDQGLTMVPLSINISAAEFRQNRFAEQVRRILDQTDVDARHIQIEITESLLMHDSEASVTTLKSLDSMGIKLAIDDFGTGYSSLSYLKRFPVQLLKIDQSFTRDITTDVDDATIVTAVIGMGKNLNLKILAEGVETDAQLDYLRAGGCDRAQGFYFSHPLSADHFSDYLRGASVPA